MLAYYKMLSGHERNPLEGNLSAAVLTTFNVTHYPRDSAHEDTNH